jgi:hypothetical protein
MKTTSDKQATADLLTALVEVVIAHGRRHYSGSGGTIGDHARGARVLAAGGVRDRRGASLLLFVAGAGGRDPLNLARLALARVAFMLS